MAQEFPEDDLVLLASLNNVALNLANKFAAQRKRSKEIHPWTKNDLGSLTDTFRMSANRLNAEVLQVNNLSRVNYLPIIKNYLVSNLQVTGISVEGRSWPEAWVVWNGQNMPELEKRTYESTTSFGLGTTIVEKNDDGTILTRSVPTNKAYAWSVDPSYADPDYGIEIVDEVNSVYKIYDKKYIWQVKITYDNAATPVKIERIWEHGFTRVPVARYINRYDSFADEFVGEIAPFIQTEKLIMKSVWDTNSTSHSQGFQVRYLLGGEAPEEDFDDEGNPTTNRTQRFLDDVRADSFIYVPDSNAQLGVLPQASLDGLLKNVEANVQHLAATSETPFFVLNASLSNISTDTALSATISSRKKVIDRQQRLARSHQYLISLQMEGLYGEIIDPSVIRVTWAPLDTSQRAALADALGKYVSSIGMPGEVFWPLLVEEGIITPEQLETAYALRDEEKASKTLFTNSLLGANADMNSAGLPEPDIEE